MRGRLLLAAGFGLAIWVAAPASASTLAVEPVAENEEVFYRAEPGEKNRVVASTDGVTVTVTDPGAVIEPGNDCVSVNDHEATCSYPGLAAVNMELGNRPDRGRINGPMITVFAEGGGGADRLLGGQLFDRFDGGRGPDVINGRGQADFLTYFGRGGDLRVTLGDGKRNDGGLLDGLKRDKLRGIESVAGGDGDDLIVGTKGENTFSAGPGRDVLRGKGGEDAFFDAEGLDRDYGGGGADLFYSGLGNDRRFGGGGDDVFQDDFDDGADLQSGGPGFDTAQYQSGHNRISLDGKANDGNCANPECTSSEEGDNVTFVEDLLVSFGDDVLIGSRRAELFRPAQGTDTVRARGGDDTVHVSPDAAVDTYNCGAGTDTIEGTADAFDLNPNCEKSAP